MNTDNPKSLLESLFDFSFSSFITTKIIKFLFALAILLSAIAAIVIVVSGFSQGFMSGLGSLLIAVLLFFVYVIAARIWLELIIVVFQIAENVSVIAKDKQGTSPVASTTPPPPPAPSRDGMAD